MGFFKSIGKAFKKASKWAAPAVAAAGGPLSVAAGAATLGIGAYNAWSKHKNYEYMKKMQKKAWSREDTAVQRRAADLRAAGMSPILAAGSAAASGSPIKLDAPSVDIDVQEMASNVRAAIKQKKDIAHTDAEIQRIMALIDLDKKNLEMRDKELNLKDREITLAERNIALKDTEILLDRLNYEDRKRNLEIVYGLRAGQRSDVSGFLTQLRDVSSGLAGNFVNPGYVRDTIDIITKGVTNVANATGKVAEQAKKQLADEIENFWNMPVPRSKAEYEERLSALDLRMRKIAPFLYGAKK